MNSRAFYEGDGVTLLYPVPFPYLSKSHVKVYLNKVPLNDPLDYKWSGDGMIELKLAPAATSALDIVRQTEANEALVRFQNGAVLTEYELNLAVLQLLYLQQESNDYIKLLLDSGVEKIGTGAGVIPGTAQEMLDALTQDVLNSELLAALQTHIEDIDYNGQNLMEQSLRIDTIEDTIDALVDVNGGGIATFLIEEQDARIEGDTAINQKIDIMGAMSGDALSFVFNLDAVKVSPTESLGTRLSGLKSSIDANTAAIVSEANTRATADSAQTSAINVMQSKVDANAAAILTEQTTRATADSANATAISTLQTTVNGHTASISTQQSVIDGLKAQYMVKLDVNGYVSGFGLYNNGSSSQFIVLADKFAVVSPGKTAAVPFLINGSTIGINGALIVNGTVHADAINATNLSAITSNLGTITAGKMTMAGGSGRNLIIEGGGTYPLWYGVGTTANETGDNPIFFVKNDGDVYFKGRLRSSNFDMRSTVIYTGGDRTAPFLIHDCANTGSPTGGTTLTCNLTTMYSPDYGSGYSGTRLANRRMDVYITAIAGGGNGTSTNSSINIEVKYDGGSWTQIATNLFNNGTEHIAFRYTTRDDITWSTMQFRVVGTPLVFTMSAWATIYNFSPSSNASGSTSNIDTGETSGGSGGGSMGGGGSWCVTEPMYLSETRRATEVEADEVYRTYVPKYGIEWHRVVAVGAPVVQPCVRIVASSGAELEVSRDTPFDLKEHGSTQAHDMLNRHVLVEDDKGNVVWERVVMCQDIGLQRVVPISFGGRSFAAGKNPKRRIYSHNMAKPLDP